MSPASSRDGRSRGWEIWIDTGGTFTDGVGRDPTGRVHRVKVLSNGALRGVVEARLGPASFRIRAPWVESIGTPRDFRFRLLGAGTGISAVRDFDTKGAVLTLDAPVGGEVDPGTAFEVLSPEEAPVLAARLLTGTPPGRALPVGAMRLATTLGTNALLTRRGTPTALFITRGLGDLLRIGTQQRPELFTLDVRKREPLYARVVEVPERIGPDGEIVEPLDAASLRTLARHLLDEGIATAAVALMHSYRTSAHEEEVRDLLLEEGFEHVSCSASLAEAINLLHRAETAVVDAYLAPSIRRYLARVGSALESARLHVMTSAGGLVTPDAYRPKDSLLSGPAGGVVGAALAGRTSGLRRLIAFDMGGTSTDVARFDGDYEYVFEHRIADAHLVAPALAIESVAAGGGSLCWFDGDRLRVGPQSAGADPGPACYGVGGPLSVTDVNLLLGRLDPARFGIPVRADAAEVAFEDLRDAVDSRHGPGSRREELLQGFLDIANERMADAIRTISLRRGYDPGGYGLVAFGGAGPQHACGVASRLGIERVVVPGDTGVLSALGLGHAVLERFSEMQVLRPLGEVAGEVAGWLDDLAERALGALDREDVPKEDREIRRRIAALRFAGQDSVLETDVDDPGRLREAFERRYFDLYGHRPEGREVELVALRVAASSRAPSVAGAESDLPVREPAAKRRQRSWFGGAWIEAPVHERDGLVPGDRVAGPALVPERHSVTVVEPGWTCDVDGAGALILRMDPEASQESMADRPEAVRLELFTHRFRTIAEQMGERLRRTAVSTNIKERLDFSCALLDPDGNLLVNAPHIPVHLGALGLCVRGMREAVPMEPGDVLVTNHPAFGGSHLPDVTVVTPVHADGPGGRPGEGVLLGYVANRAHHAEIGGARPGSMPPSATHLVEEGVVLPPTHVVRQGAPRWDVVRSLLSGAPHPSRAAEDNLADLKAAVAANHAGAGALVDLAREVGPSAVLHYMRELEGVAERRMREALARLDDGSFHAAERLDDGTPLEVEIAIRGDRAEIDFEGSGAVHPGNLNATPAIVHSAVIYFLRLLIHDPIPLNEGILRAVSIRIPPGILSPDFPDDPALAPAVVGGNVETSQRLVDTLTKALGLAGCSQGTMNNVLFGDDRSSYYETVCGGCGGGPGFDGASAVHSNMTNTRITDPEILEFRHPVRVERFGIREGSGGVGRRPGGDGAVRELRFLADLSLSVLTQHRVEAPFGTAGGGSGKPGRQRVIRADGSEEELGPVDGTEVGPGDRFVLETPGGGGYGDPDEA